MLSNYYTLAAVASDLDHRIRSKRIKQAFTQEKDELVLSFEDTTEVLIISCSPHINTLYIHPKFARAKTNSVDVLKELVGRAVRSISIRPGDRVIEFQLDGGFVLYAQFFGPKANALLVDGDHRVRDAFKHGRSVKGSEYVPSDNELVHDVGMIRALIIKESGHTVFNLLKRASPLLGSTLAEEILYRAGVPLSATGDDLTKDRLTGLESSYATLLTELAHPQPRVYTAKDPPHAPYHFSLVRLEHCRGFAEQRFDDINEAIRFHVARMKASGVIRSFANEVETSLRQHHAKLSRAIGAVEDDLARAERSDMYERYAALLMTHAGMVSKGMNSFTIEENGEHLVIPLDAKLTSIQNAQRYYEKARKGRAAREQSRNRSVELKQTFRLVEDLLTTAGRLTSKDELRHFMSERAAELARFGIGEKAKQREQLPFRIFNVDGGFEVWAGKSSKNNDELTLKYAKPDDLWFHARGASGSHVILRAGSAKGEPGKKAKAQAASIAAYYSKMKNASMVPVAMTEKKYVRKPKGAPPGTVVLEREKVIFAEPMLPHAAPTNE